MPATPQRRLLAVSDLHVKQPQNRRFVEELLPASKDDWLILAGDLGETADDLRFVFESLAPRFDKLFWVPGNHELWTIEEGGLRGEERYASLIDVCRSFGVLTPEDPYIEFDSDLVIAPMFLLYDYSFRPSDILSTADALKWAAEHGLKCADEILLHPTPHATREAWCAERIRITRARLDALPESTSTILVNHFPLRKEHARLPLLPRFSIWCGTTETEDWHQRYRARAVVFGHLHIRQKREVDGVTFHEVSLGYKRQWNSESADRHERYVRHVWPPPATAQ